MSIWRHPGVVGSNPTGAIFIMEERTDKIISFLKEIDKFKDVKREIFLKDRNENDAEHSWHLAMFVILFERDLPEKLDFKKMLKFALMHDLVEIYAGDTFFFDEEGRKDKKEREEKAAQRLFSQLPEDLANDFFGLFREYEDSETEESKIVHAFDKMHPLLQNLISEGKTWKKHDISYEKLDKNKRKYVENNQLTFNIYEKFMKEAKDKGFLK